MVPTTLTASIRSSAFCSKSATLVCEVTEMPALLTSAVSGPKASSARNIASTCCCEATSAWTAMARPPPCSISPTSASACSRATR